VLLLVGLGNPGPEHAWNRHNIGFMAVDAIAQAHDFAPYRRRFHGLIADGHVDGARVLALKPTTYMNRSGVSVGEAMAFFKLKPGQVTVLHDELDLAPGKVRVKTGGGSAGHNGLRSIDAHIGPDYRRVRLGIGRPESRQSGHAYVLRDFSGDDQQWLDRLLPALADAAPLLVAGDDNRFMNRVAVVLNPRPQPPAPKDENGSDGI